MDCIFLWIGVTISIFDKIVESFFDIEENFLNNLQIQIWQIMRIAHKDGDRIE